MSSPVAGLDLAPADVEVERRDDGSLLLRSPQALGSYDPTLGALLRHWAAQQPNAVFLAERAPTGDWRQLTWDEAQDAARSVGQALVDRGLGRDRPVAILSGNSIDHAILTLGGLLVGVPVVPISVAYSLLSQDHGRLRSILELVTPGLVFAQQGAPFEAALRIAAEQDAEVVVGDRPPGDLPTTSFDALRSTPPGESFDRAQAQVGADTMAKILLTSGSTGAPKGVINTHGMLTANQQMLVQAWPFVLQTPPVLVDWLPWSHTFGANHNFNLILKTGGTLYIDGGKPTPDLFGETLRNLADVAPTIQFNVPAGYAMLAAALERDDELRRRCFSRLQVIFYAAAAMPVDVWQRLDRLAAATLGHHVWMTTAWGATETSPLATSAHYPTDHPAIIGLPVPGCELKLLPSGRKLEVRVRGRHVTPGYHRAPDRTAAAFDDEGFYRTGDAMRFADPGEPSRGLVFDGRIAEDFKLQSGTWVHVGSVLTGALSATAGLLVNGVVTGHDREAVGLLVWLNPDRAGAVAGADRPADDLVTDPAIHAVLRRHLEPHNLEVQGSSRRIARVMLLAEPPVLDAGEITDKGYVNQRAVLERRAADVERLYATDPPPNVVVLD